MTQEEKELLFKDLCARLPYGVKMINTEPYSDNHNPILTLSHISEDNAIGCRAGKGFMTTSLGSIKPYLFPLSSMTDELWDKEFRGYDITEFTLDSFKCGCETLEFYDHNPDLSSMVGFINQLIKHHFDIYGLISKGLAIDATGKDIY